MGGNSNPQTNDIWRFDLNFDIDNIQTNSTIRNAGHSNNRGTISTNVSVEVTNFTENTISNLEVKFYYTTAASTITLENARHIKTVTQNINRRKIETFSAGNITIPETATYLLACIQNSLCINKKLEVDLIRWSEIGGGEVVSQGIGGEVFFF